MRLVLDASVVLPLIAFDTDQAERLRDWTEQKLGGNTAHIIRNLTPLEVTSALHKLSVSGEIDADHATNVHRRIFGWPFVREDLTQPRIERIWELRHHFAPYDAMYLAVTESLQSHYLEDVALLTADSELCGASHATLGCRVITFPDN